MEELYLLSIKTLLVMLEKLDLYGESGNRPVLESQVIQSVLTSPFGYAVQRILEKTNVLKESKETLIWVLERVIRQGIPINKYLTGMGLQRTLLLIIISLLAKE
jgi:hypothetical protein